MTFEAAPGMKVEREGSRDEVNGKFKRKSIRSRWPNEARCEIPHWKVSIASQIRIVREINRLMEFIFLLEVLRQLKAEMPATVNFGRQVEERSV